MSDLIRSLQRGLLPVALAAMAGCSSWGGHSDRFMGVVPLYRVEIVQGNVVTKEMATRATPGMSREQVRDVLGSPMVADVFHADRWDYAFSIRRQGTEPQARRVVAWFDGDKLKKLDVPADLPTESEFVASINTFKAKGDSPKLALTDTERAALPKPARAEAKAAEPSGPTRAFPPLEK